jgi:uncharacterized membrane protein YhiD involved in acid resistance
MKKSIDQATTAVMLWFAAFSAGLVVGAEHSPAVGLLIMAAATLVLAVKLAASGREESQQRQLYKLRQSDARQIEEAMKHD